MGQIFNAEEIFELAEELERSGNAYYLEAANNVANPTYSQLLMELATMEKEHEDFFNSLKKSFAEKNLFQMDMDLQGEAILYLRSIIDTQQFFKMDTDFSSMESILKNAIVSERESIVFYLGMQKLVPEDLGKEKLNLIITEEMGHIRQLSERLRDLELDQ